MSEQLLPYYDRELTWVRKSARDFAEAHPKMASRLRLGGDGRSEDPHVERLIEAFAFSCARIRHKLDDGFPEITDAMLGVLYPHYQAPVPSMAIVQLGLDRGQGDLVAGQPVPRGSTVETEPIDGDPCRFRTCYDVNVLPLEVTRAALGSIPFNPPEAARRARATAMLRIGVRGYAPSIPLAKYRMPSLRFYLEGQAQHTQLLYELLFNNTAEVCLARPDGKSEPVMLGSSALRPVGFEQDEAVLPAPSRSFPGYRLLSEYFCFPAKFLFVEVTGLDAERLGGFEGEMEIQVFLTASSPRLEQNVEAGTFRLGCTPVVNLFEQRAEPIALNHTGYEYRIVPDARRPMAMEVFSVESVTATSPRNEHVHFAPFYSHQHGAEASERTAFWYATRRPAGRTGRRVDPGTDVFLSLVDMGFSPAAPPDWTLDVRTVCLNRDLPQRLPFGGGQPRLTLQGGGPVTQVGCLTQPTATLRPALKQGALWRIISHLTLNYLSLVDGDEGGDALKEILTLYDLHDSPETQSRIGSITAIEARRAVFRAGADMAGGFCRGLEVTVQFNRERFSDHGLFLFASVLERFLALYCTINSFTQMVATTEQRTGEFHRWPPRAGEQPLL